MSTRDADSPVYTLFQIGNAIHHLNRKYERETGLSLVQWHMLNRLKDLPATSPQALATVMGIHPSTLTQTMKRLEKKGLIFVGDNPKDSRKKIILLTRSGKAALDKANEKIELGSRDLKGHVDDLTRLHRYLANRITS
jgi:DNA-binding MarR family transcriptional regulator